ncbi:MULTISPECIES: DJ-1/PfpI family protein [unclassified Nostoc]|uniref:DJ-1/PfpI family protein n=1 Tax=unclassified Nostoc TaxID=2593658 RepID=UPI0025AB51BA|nr:MULTISPECIES: DJ-1/PfpI family protein [unclassified Nostoc]MDM9584021.1 DJ-1/PfpI family protein [Nostoc sp. GT001]MDZ7943653.1 DJ-1/PfpI family protein [Nostoc sp. EfeVER01]MDZ7991660.1 DJ-1/PfpI family protein [Nostoc sp. EspVER01]
MIPRSLGGKKIAILLESEFIPEEIEAYQKRFSELQATVHLMSRLWDQPSVRFFSDEDTGNTPRTIDVNIDFQNVDVNDYAAVIMTANYTSVRLRYFEPPIGQPISAEQVRTSPAVQFYAKAMANPRIIKGALCHGLWILTPIPELLKDRQVICHEVVLADILNAGAVYTTSPTGVVVDGDLVTGRSKHEVEPFIDAITEQIQQLSIATNRFSNRRATTSVSRLKVAS